jgi:hypothetical protein
LFLELVQIKDPVDAITTPTDGFAQSLKQVKVNESRQNLQKSNYRMRQNDGKVILI